MISPEMLLAKIEKAINQARETEEAPGGTERDQGITNGLIKGYDIVLEYLTKED